MSLRIAAGRRLRWSPHWSTEEASVLFDSASGDFWVLAPPSREMLTRVQAEPGVHMQALLAQGAWQADELESAVAALRDAGVLAPGPELIDQ